MNFKSQPYPKAVGRHPNPWRTYITVRWGYIERLMALALYNVTFGIIQFCEKLFFNNRDPHRVEGTEYFLTSNNIPHGIEEAPPSALTSRLLITLTCRIHKFELALELCILDAIVIESPTCPGFSRK